MAFMVLHLETADYDRFKSYFDTDPAGRSETAKQHVLLRGVDDPNEVFIRVEFGSIDDAKAFRDKLLASGALGGVTVKTPPTVVQVVEVVDY